MPPSLPSPYHLSQKYRHIRCHHHCRQQGPIQFLVMAFVVIIVTIIFVVKSSSSTSSSSSLSRLPLIVCCLTFLCGVLAIKMRLGLVYAVYDVIVVIVVFVIVVLCCLRRHPHGNFPFPLFNSYLLSFAGKRRESRRDIALKNAFQQRLKPRYNSIK